MAIYESENIEYKLQYTPEIKKEIVAFANTSGGTLYIGVADDGTEVGIDDPDTVMQQLSSAIRDGIRPDVTMFTQMEIQEATGHSIIAVTVSTGTRRPYYLSDKGLRPSGVYTRQGSTSAPVSEDAIRQMIRQTDGDTFENGRSLLQKLSFSAFEQEMQRRQLPCGSAQMQTLGIISFDGLYTNLGLLVSDQCRHSIKMAIFQGTDKIVFRDRKEFTGSIFSQLSDAYAAIDFYNSTQARFDGLLRIDERDYPMDAVREALLNAIVHRDYGFSGSISINLYADRMEFISLGGLVPGFSLQAALMGASQPRNEKLAALFYRMRLIEAYGTGLGKIINCYTGKKRQPTFECVDGAFRVTLPNLHYSMDMATNTNNLSLLNLKTLSPSEQKAAQAITSVRSMSRRELEAALGVKTTRAISIIQNLLAAGIIEKIGNGKETRYQIASQY